MVGTRRLSLNKKKTICVQCKLQVLDNDDSIQCDACEKTFHSLCTKLDKRQYEKLVKNSSLTYNCHLCDGSSERSSVSNDLLEIKTKLKQLDQLDEVTKTIQFMSSQYDSILKGVAANKKRIDSLQKENDSLREEVRSLKSSVKYLNDNNVKNDCVINGVEASDDEKAIDVVLKIAGKIGAEIKADQVDDAYFLQNRNKDNKNASKKRSVVVKFSTKTQKQKFMAEKSKLRQSEELKTVFINDFLCRESMELLNYAKSVKAVGYKFVFARGAKVFVRKDEKSRIIFIRSMDDVDKILMRASQGIPAVRRSHVTTINDDSSESAEEEEEDGDDDNSFQSPN